MDKRDRLPLIDYDQLTITNSTDIDPKFFKRTQSVVVIFLTSINYQLF